MDKLEQMAREIRIHNLRMRINSLEMRIRQNQAVNKILKSKKSQDEKRQELLDRRLDKRLIDLLLTPNEAGKIEMLSSVKLKSEIRTQERILKTLEG